MPLFSKHHSGAQRFRMPWGAAVGGIGGALISAEAGGGTTSTDSGPWAAAQPLLARNAMQADALQNQYTAMPFNQQQLAAYDNKFALNDYLRNLVPELLGQIQGQPVGFDRNNPTARPQAWNFNAGGGALGQTSLRDAQGRQAAIDAQDQRESEDLIAGRRDTTRFFPLGLTYGDLKPKQ
ncbi:hypothetical protein [Variovorax sp. DAIF25]|uniref:hypothetical protein n=1 Tax=Variovorax sp. DAIF25 TaxID=3080983 RepID=UPI003D6C44C5